MDKQGVFAWVDFYQEFADKLLQYKDNRQELIKKVEQMFDITGIKKPQLDTENQIVDMDWHPNSKFILIGYSNGTIDEIEVPVQYDKTRTFIFNSPKRRNFK